MFHESFTSCEPGPEYWYMMTGYFFCGSQSRGFTIQPLSSTPSAVRSEKSSFRASRGVTFCFSSSLSSMVVSSLPSEAWRSVVTGGCCVEE